MINDLNFSHKKLGLFFFFSSPSFFSAHANIQIDNFYFFFSQRSHSSELPWGQKVS